MITESFYAQRARLFMWMPVWQACGIGLYFARRGEPSLQHIIVAVAVIVFCLLPILRWYSIWRAFFWIPLLVALGFLLASGRSQWVGAPKLGWYFYGALEGTIAHIDKSASGKPRLTLIDPVLERLSPAKTPKRLRVSLHSPLQGTEIQPGARVMITASLSPPAGPVEPGGFDFQRKAWFQGLGAVGYSRLPVMLAQPAQINSFALRVFALRMQFSGAIRRAIDGQPGAFAAAILTGDRSALDPALVQNLRRSNLAHLLAISGLHMGLLTGFIFAIVRYSMALIPYVALRLPTKKIAAVIALLAGLGYLLLSGANVATQRAYVMVLVMLVAVLVDQPAITLRAVSVAALIILIGRPESLIEPGFQMSFAATTALVATFEALKRSKTWRALQSTRLPLLQPTLALIVSSAVAGAATAPISAFHFNQVAHYGLIANLASVPVMGFLIMPAAVIAGVLGLFGLAAPAFWVMGLGIEWILNVAAWVSSIEGALSHIPSAPAVILALLCFAALFVVLWKGRLRVIGVVPMIVAFSLWMQVERPQILITDTGRLVGVQQRNLRTLNRHKGNSFAARAWLENDADAVSQKVAAARMDFNADDWMLNVGSHKIAYVWPKKTPVQVMQRRCNMADLLIAPNLTVALDGPCKVIARQEFKAKGSFALNSLAGTLKIQSARDWTGERLWNQ